MALLSSNPLYLPLPNTNLLYPNLTDFFSTTPLFWQTIFTYSQVYDYLPDSNWLNSTILYSNWLYPTSACSTRILWTFTYRTLIFINSAQHYPTLCFVTNSNRRFVTLCISNLTLPNINLLYPNMNESFLLDISANLAYF